MIFNLFLFPLLGEVHDLPGQDTDADDTTVQCCGSEPYLTTHGICCNDAITPFYSPELDLKDALECCDNQACNWRTEFCYTCGKKKHVLPLSQKQSWSCCNDKEIYKNDESRCCEYGVEKERQCKFDICLIISYKIAMSSYTF